MVRRNYNFSPFDRRKDSFDAAQNIGILVLIVRQKSTTRSNSADTMRNNTQLLYRFTW